MAVDPASVPEPENGNGQPKRKPKTKPAKS